MISYPAKVISENLALSSIPSLISLNNNLLLPVEVWALVFDVHMLPQSFQDHQSRTHMKTKIKLPFLTLGFVSSWCFVLCFEIRVLNGLALNSLYSEGWSWTFTPFLHPQNAGIAGLHHHAHQMELPIPPTACRQRSWVTGGFGTLWTKASGMSAGFPSLLCVFLQHHLALLLTHGCAWLHDSGLRSKEKCPS